MRELGFETVSLFSRYFKSTMVDLSPSVSARALLQRLIAGRNSEKT